MQALGLGGRQARFGHHRLRTSRPGLEQPPARIRFGASPVDQAAGAMADGMKRLTKASEVSATSLQPLSMVSA